MGKYLNTSFSEVTPVPKIPVPTQGQTHAGKPIGSGGAGGEFIVCSAKFELYSILKLEFKTEKVMYLKLNL